MSRPAAWQPPSEAETWASVVKWLDQQQADAATRQQVEQQWNAPREPAAPLLERLVRALAVADPRARALVAFTAAPRGSRKLPEVGWLKEDGTPPLLAANLRLWHARWLVLESLHDEAHELLEGLQPADVVDPASLLFYQAVCCHRLLLRDAGLAAIDTLLADEARSPRRYVVVARLMRADLEGLEDDSLDHIARRMDDIRRRLDQGRANRKVQDLEKGVVESLDKLIKEMEEKQQQQQAGQGQGSIQSSSPAQESQIMPGQGPGEVTRRNIGSESGWGDLPPKEREEALQEIGRDFPAHYRDVIEQYFRNLAAGNDENR